MNKRRLKRGRQSIPFCNLIFKTLSKKPKEKHL